MTPDNKQRPIQKKEETKSAQGQPPRVSPILHLPNDLPPETDLTTLKPLTQKVNENGEIEVISWLMTATNDTTDNNQSWSNLNHVNIAAPLPFDYAFEEPMTDRGNQPSLQQPLESSSNRDGDLTPSAQSQTNSSFQAAATATATATATVRQTGQTRHSNPSRKRLSQLLIYQLQKAAKILLAGCLLLAILVFVISRVWPVGRSSSSDHATGGGSNTPTFTPPLAVNLAFTLQPKLEYQYQISQQLAEQNQVLTKIEATVTLTATVKATGTLQIADGRASGSVRFLNATTSPVYLSAGTLIATLGSGANRVSYHLTAAVNVPATNIAAAHAGFAEAVVQADQPGPVGNIPGGLGTFSLRGGTLQVGGLGPVTGGTNRQAAIATEQDISSAKAGLTAQLNQAVNTALDGKLPAAATSATSGWQRFTPGTFEVSSQLFAASVKPGVEITPGANASAGVAGGTGGGGIDGSSFGVTLTVQAHTQAFDAAGLLKLAAYQPSAQSVYSSQPALGITTTVTALPSAVALIQLGPAQFESLTLTKDVPGDLIVSYNRQVQAQALEQTLTGWKGNLVELQQLIERLKADPTSGAAVELVAILDAKGGQAIITTTTITTVTPGAQTSTAAATTSTGISSEHGTPGTQAILATAATISNQTRVVVGKVDLSFQSVGNGQ